MAVSGYAFYYLSVAPLKVENQELFEENTAFELAMKEQAETIRRIEENIESRSSFFRRPRFNYLSFLGTQEF